MVQVRNLRGELVTHSFSRKEDAELFERTEKRKRQLGKAGLEAPQDEILFIDYVKAWLTKRSTGKQSSFRQDESRLKNYWIEPFGAYPIQHMSTALIKERLDQIQFTMKHSPADRNRHRALLHKLFQDAYLEDRIIANPVSKIPLIDESKKTRTSGTIQTSKDQDAYVEALYSEATQYGMLGDLMLWSGARIMAAAAIQYRDIDFEIGIVRIRRLFERASGTIQERTKGQGDLGEEIVPLFPRLRDRILAHRKVSEFIRPSDFIACQPDGSPIPYETFMGVHERALTSTKLTRFTPHALRKAFATNAKRAGYTRSEIREMLGHSSDAVTARYDLKDVEHLIEKGKRLKFGSSVSRLSAKQIKKHRI
jgi:integrase